MLKNNKSQVTIFIILGLLILIGAIFMIYLKSVGSESNNIEIVTENIPNDFKPAQNHITNCLFQIGKEGIQKIGTNGGYIDANNPEYTGEQLNFNEANPTESDGVVISSDMSVPYWYHMDTPNTCELNECDTSFGFPLLEDIEYQLSLYIGKNIDKCIDGLNESLKEQGAELTKETIPVLRTSINKEDISLRMDYKINIMFQGKEETLNFFITKLDINLGNSYTLALLLANAEGTNRILEKTLSLIMSNYQGPDFNLLPPVYASTTGPMQVIWPKTLVELRIQDLLKAYTPIYKVENTDNGVILDAEGSTVLKNIYDYAFITNPFNLSGMEVRFHYMDWPIYLDITPSADGGETIKPDVDETEIPLSSTVIRNTYSFKYDIAFPTLVEIKDKTAFDNQGYSLFFALEGNIKSNEDIYSYMLQYPLNPDLPDDLFELEGFDQDEYSGSVPLEDDYPAGEFAFGEDGSLPNIQDSDMKKVTKPNIPPNNHFCDEEQKLGPEIEFYVTDKLSNDPIEEAVVYYKCGPFYSCRIAFTDETGYAKGKLPLCETGAIKFEKTGYSNIYKTYDSRVDGENDVVSGELYKPLEKKFKILMLDAADLDTFVNMDSENPKESAKLFKEENAYEEIHQDTNVMMMITKKDDNAYNDQFFNAFNLAGINSDLSGEMTLLPAEYGTGVGYEVRIFYINNSEHFAKGSGYCKDCCEIIEEDDTPQQTEPGELPNINLDEPEEECDGGYTIGCPEENKRFIISSQGDSNPIIIEKSMQGMSTISEESTTFLWHIDYEEVADEEKDMVVFYIIKAKLPEYAKNLIDMTNVNKMSEKYSYYIMPDLIDSNQIYNKYQRVTLNSATS